VVIVTLRILCNSPAERAWFRLAAGCAMLKICEQKGVGDRYTLEQFYTLSTLFIDPVPEVRERMLSKLHKVRSCSLRTQTVIR
jgi:sister-chromatid-cohesion protein PDS5